MTCVSAVQGDITQLSVDAIVNAANAQMKHVGGLAGQVIAKGETTLKNFFCQNS